MEWDETVKEGRQIGNENDGVLKGGRSLKGPSVSSSGGESHTWERVRRY